MYIAPSSVLLALYGLSTNVTITHQTLRPATAEGLSISRSDCRFLTRADILADRVESCTPFCYEQLPDWAFDAAVERFDEDYESLPGPQVLFPAERVVRKVEEMRNTHAIEFLKAFERHADTAFECNHIHQENDPRLRELLLIDGPAAVHEEIQRRRAVLKEAYQSSTDSFKDYVKAFVRLWYSNTVHNRLEAAFTDELEDAP